MSWLIRMSVAREQEVDGELWECVATHSRPGFVLRDKKGQVHHDGQLPGGRTLCDVTDAELAVEVRRVIYI